MVLRTKQRAPPIKAAITCIATHPPGFDAESKTVVAVADRLWLILVRSHWTQPLAVCLSWPLHYLRLKWLFRTWNTAELRNCTASRAHTPIPKISAFLGNLFLQPSLHKAISLIIRPLESSSAGLSPWLPSVFSCGKSHPPFIPLHTYISGQSIQSNKRRNTHVAATYTR